jgi:hypothetical protein
MKIKTKLNVKYSISEVMPNIFCVKFANQYDMCMTFLRYQEFYESPNTKFRGKRFKLVEFMDWYSKKYGNGLFTYTTDWLGFNIPGKTIHSVMYQNIIDKNYYDSLMLKISETCFQKTKSHDYYLIGVLKGKQKELFSALNHEIAHGLFATNKEYKKSTLELLKLIPRDIQSKINKYLLRAGYCKQVLKDETQAYMSTGLPPELSILFINEKLNIIFQFENNFKEFKK